ncbi:hypothetical protein D1007_08385 [Hordeum vulgare]|nr:hypothetical protein D1007_08385 [Hordeum vulgare]
MGKAVFWDRDNLSPEDPSTDATESCEIDPVVGLALSSRERSSAMRTAIASSNPHGTTPQSKDSNWLESDPLPNRVEKARDRRTRAWVAEWNMDDDQTFLDTIGFGYTQTQPNSSIGEQATPSTQHRSAITEKGKSNKENNWSSDEDKVLIAAWANTSLDIVGTD